MSEADEQIDILGEINRHLNRQPFESFVIVMTSGDRYAIEQAWTAAIARGVISIVPPRQGGQKLLRLSHISSVEFPEPGTSEAT